MDELKRLLVLSGQREKYAPVTEGVILHVRNSGKEIMSLRLESMMAMRPVATTLQKNGFDDLEYTDQEVDHRKIGKDMDYGDDEMGMDDEMPEDPLSAAQEAAEKFASLEVDEMELPEDMAEKLSHLAVCLKDVCNELCGDDDEDMDEPEMDMDMEPEMPRMEGNDYSKKTDAELKYIQKDASDAAKAMKGQDDKAEAKYLDQVNDASTELHKRSQKNKKESLEERELNKDEKAKLDALKKKHEGGEMEKAIIDQYGEKEGKGIFYGKLTKMAKEGVEYHNADSLIRVLKRLGDDITDRQSEKIQYHIDKLGPIEQGKVLDFIAQSQGRQVPGEVPAHMEGKQGRDRDTKHTGGLSKSINDAEKKALKAKERQQGKKEASVEEAAVNATVFDNTAMPADAVDDMQQKAERTGQAQRTDTKNKVPKEIMAVIDKRIKELKKSIDRYDEKGYNEKSVKTNAIEALEQIKKNLGRGDLEGFMEAQVYFGTLMSPIWDLFPGQLVNYIAKGDDTI